MNRSIPRACGILCFALTLCGCGTDRSWYVGGSIGHVSTGADDCTSQSGNYGGSFTASSCTLSSNGVGSAIVGGYQFNRYVAVEGGGTTLGTFHEQANGTSTSFGSTQPGQQTDNSRMDLLALYAVGTLPVTSELSLTGRFGLGATVSGDGVVAGGGGLQYNFTRKLAARLEYQRFYGSGPLAIDWHADMLSVGLVYYFQRR